MKKPRVNLVGLLLFCAAGTAAAQEAAKDITYFVEPCTTPALACAPEDMDLARWAFAAWQDASQGKLRLIESKDRATALIRLRWAPKNGGLYGETMHISVQGREGAEIHVRAEAPPEPGKGDRLLRDAIVYLTCLHESGHALGLDHTRAFADIMYSFEYGGDIDEYFARYRRKLTMREDIRKNAGMSPADRSALLSEIATKGKGEGVLR
jgi:hypothetical protein